MIKFIVSLLILIMCGLTSRCQEAKLNALDSFSGLFLKRLNASESEKAFLTVNKSIYKPGEVIWFRAFLVHSISEKISVQSKYLFVDLVDNNDNVISTTILNAQQQQTNGKIALSDSLLTGYYWVRAYTQKMASSDTNNIAILPVYILNPANPNSARFDKRQMETSGEIEPILEIFPEGGTIMTGINSIVTFYLHDQFYRPISLRGVIKDSRDTLISEFTTNTYGLGKAELSPSFFYKYKAIINYNGREKRVDFPPFNRFTGQLSVFNNAGGNLKCRVILEDSIYKKDALTYIIGFAKNELCFAGIGYGSYETNISLQKFPDGIATLLLFNKDFKLLSERNIYIKQNNVNVKIETDKEVYSKRSKGNLFVSVTDQNNHPISSSIAVSISDSLTALENESFIKSTAALKAKEGTLSNWDIIQMNSISQEDLDMLMMCMKSSFSKGFLPAKELVEDNDQVFYISGKVIDKKGLPLPDKDLTLLVNAESNIFADTTNASGKFNFAVSAFPDSTQFVIHVNNKKGNTEYPAIVLDKIKFPSLHTPGHLKLQPAISNSAKTKFLKLYADTSDIAIKNDWLKPVSVKTNAKSNFDHTGRISSSTIVMSSEELIRLGTGKIGLGLLRIPGVIINNGYLTFYGSDRMGGANANSEPMVLYDGNQVSLAGGESGQSPVISYLNTLNPRVIEFIEVIKGPEASVYGLRGGGGVIFIHSSSTIKEDFKTDGSGAFKFIRQGIAKPVLYPSVNYSSKEVKDVSFIDTRSTLYWNGNELTDIKGNINYIFYTNDIGGKYKITVTGVTIHGDLIYKTLSIGNR
ncbi:MAG TPA: Plug domain-containing protein [Flavisolibacter sp.]|nr:Plug domain-containing protein [Flavisolibacter sp.]